MNTASRNLKVWLLDHQMEQQQFAHAIGTNASTISRIINCISLPSLEIALKIEKHTDGEVRAHDWTVPFRPNGKQDVPNEKEKVPL